MTDRIILGENAIYSSDCDVTGLNNNILVCGTSGCGKTMSVTEPRLLETFETSLVATVTKRRIVDQYRDMLKERGYCVEEFNLAEPSRSTVAYDPALYLTDSNDIHYLAEAVVYADPRKKNSRADPYFDEAAVCLVSALICYLKEINGTVRFSQVLSLFRELEIEEGCSRSIETNFDRRFECFDRLHPDSQAVKYWKTFCNLPLRTASCVYSSATVAINTMFTSQMMDILENKRVLDIESISRSKTVLFVVTSPVSSISNRFANLFYGQLFKSLFEYAEKQPDGKLPRPVHVLCDDFATGGVILDFAEKISIFREKLISVTLLIQSESQLAGMYGREDATTIINNCDTYLYMGGMDIETCRDISIRMDMPLEDVLYMPVGTEFIMRRGSRPMVTERYDIINDPVYQSVREQNSRRER